ncbi:HIT family protein [Bacillus wiedmannii]|uniref:HIT family protein n=1 Tax=Bacillus wiedmannii TaxID=1890302 RepID=UPI003CF40168
MECLGCKLANEQEIIYKIYEDDYVTCFLDHEPFYPGHTLIVPKQHVVEVDELDDIVAKSIMDLPSLLQKRLSYYINQMALQFVKMVESLMS